MTTMPETAPTGSGAAKEIEVKVDYLPAAAPFQGRFPADTPVETVRRAAMAFFGVQDRQERDTYHYYIEVGGTRITDTTQPISAFVQHGHELHCHLVEQITPGTV